MKNMKRLFALLVAIMILVAGVAAYATESDPADTGSGEEAPTASYKITLESTATEQTQANTTTYTWYEILKADIADEDTAAYYVEDEALATAIDAIEGFKVTRVGETDRWNVVYEGEATGPEMAALLNVSAITSKAIATGTVTADGREDVVIEAPEAGYYLIVADNGKNLVLQTLGDVTITEKNTYPPIDKTQGDEDVETQNHDDRDVAVGDVLTYNVTVTVPASAKVDDKIQVWDKATEGLTYNDDLASVPADVSTAATLEEGDTWRQNIVITEDLIGKSIVFTFTMTVNSSALVDTGKENEAGLKYGNDNDWYYESKPIEVKYKTYFAGIHKIDGKTNEDLKGVKFVLKEGDAEFKVTKHTDGYYYYDANGSSEVVTDANGLILIRGLDEDKTYTLTETETLPGYNLLETPVTLTLYEDTVTVVTADGETTTTTSFDPSKTSDKWGEVKNNKGSTLPSTGGVGTTIFYVGGSILVIAAVILLVTKRRMSTHD